MKCGIPDDETPHLKSQFPVGCQYGFRVELDTVYVIFSMFQRHDLSFGADGGDGKFVGKLLRVHYPGVVSSDGNPIG